MFYLIGEADKTDFSTISKEVTEMVAKYGGTVLPKQITEERRLAYPIDKQRNGLYVAQRFTLPDTDELDEMTDAPTNPIADMNTQLILHKKVLRAIIVSAAGLPPLMTKDEKEAADVARDAADATAKSTVSDKDTDKQLADALHI